MPFFNPDVITDQTLVLLGAIVVNEFVLLASERGKVDGDDSGGQTGIPRGASLVNDSRRLDQVLRRQAPAVDAGPPDGPLLDHYR